MARRRIGAKRLKETRELMIAERERLEATRPASPYRDRRVTLLTEAITDVGRALSALMGDDPTPDWPRVTRRAQQAARHGNWERAAVYVGRMIERPAWRRAPSRGHSYAVSQ